MKKPCSPLHEIQSGGAHPQREKSIMTLGWQSTGSQTALSQHTASPALRQRGWLEKCPEAHSSSNGTKPP